MGAEQIASQLTVVMHTYDRPDYVEADVREGRWDGIPLLISDDASSPEVQVRLESLARERGFGFTASAENGGAAQAAKAGVEFAQTEFFALCGDDDYLRDFNSFAELALPVAQEPETLFVAMPEVRFLAPGRPQRVQFDRRVFDGMPGRKLLRELVFGGEMRALQAGTVIRRTDALPHFASSLIRTSEDFLLMCRLCAQRPDAVIRVPSIGTYMRREHPGSLSHRSNMSTERAATNLITLLAGARLLQSLEGLEDDVLIGVVRQRAQILAEVYNAGLGAMGVIESLLNNQPPPRETPEQIEALAFLRSNRSRLPVELGLLKNQLDQTAAVPGPASAATSVAQAISFLDSGQLDEAEGALGEIDRASLADPTDYETVRGRLAWASGDPNGAVRHLSTALVHDPDAVDALHMLSQIADAAGEREPAARLAQRLHRLVPSAATAVSADQSVDDVRVAFIVSSGLDQFLTDIIRELVPFVDARKFVVADRADIEAAMVWADVCWFEWCNDPIVWASRQDVMRHKPTICRLHRYEAFSDMPLKVQWEQVDCLMVVAEHLAEIVTSAIPGLKQRTNIVYVPNGVDMSRYEFQVRTPGYDIALIGYLHGRKNPQMALQIMRDLVNLDDRYRLHVAGKFQDPVLQLYWADQVIKLGLEANVVMYEWQSDIAAFLDDKNYILSTSIHESFGYSIAEAMARGIKPVVHNFPFATDIWPEEMLFSSVREAVETITSDHYDSNGYRAFVQDHYSLDSQVVRIRELIASLVKEAKGETRAHSLENVESVHPRMVNAELAGRCPACRHALTVQVQTIAGHPVGRDRCPNCNQPLYVPDSVYREALSALEQRMLEGDLHAETRRLGAVASNWASHPDWERVFKIDGLNLGKAMEFEILPYLVRAWMKLREEEVTT